MTLPADDPPHRGSGAIPAEPLTEGGQRTGADDISLGRDPLQGELVPLPDAARSAHVPDAFMSRQRQRRRVASRSVHVAGEAPLHQLGLELRVHDVGLHHRVHVLFVDLDDAVHAPHVQLDAARAAGVAVDPPAGAGGFELDSEPVAQPHDRLDLFGAPRHEDGLKTGLELLGRGGLARAPGPGIQVHRLVRDVLRPDDGLEGLILLFRECHFPTPLISLCPRSRRHRGP